MKSDKPSEMLILAGGFGTRLRSVVSDVPKPMAPVGDRPFLEYLLDHWINQGIRRFILSTGHLSHVIEGHFGSCYRGVTIDYVCEESPLGTGGALRLSLSGRLWGSEVAVMANGDTWFPVCLARMCFDAAQQENAITIALKAVRDNDRYSGVEVDANGKIKAFGVKSGGLTYINGGCYLFNVAIVRQLLARLPQSFSLENDFFAPCASNGLLGASIQERPFLDIGLPGDYQKAPTLLK